MWRARARKRPVCTQAASVCNGYELSSGAIRNHDPDVMLKAFEIAGYAREETEVKFESSLSGEITLVVTIQGNCGGQDDGSRHSQ